MKRVVLAVLGLLAIGPLWASRVWAMEGHEPTVWALKVSELEGYWLERSRLEKYGESGEGGEGGLAWHVALGGGSDLHQLWLETEGERTGGDTGEHELSLHYRRVLTPFWNLHAGWRGDRGHGADRDWLLLGLRGDAPFHIDTEINLYLGDNDRMALEIDVEKVLRLTRRWLLTPELGIVFHGGDDPSAATGPGLSHIEAGLRLGYEVTPRLVPYAGVVWEKSVGKTALYRRAEDREVEAGRVVLGLRLWL